MPANPAAFYMFSPGEKLSLSSLFTLIFFYTFLSIEANAETSLNQSAISNQISNGVVTAIHLDGDGFLWIGTQGDLFRFQGKDFSTFSLPTNQLTHSKITGVNNILEASNGTIYVATYSNGLLIWNREKSTFERDTRLDIVHPNAKIIEAFSDSSGHFWINTSDGLYVFDTKSKKVLSWITESLDLPRSRETRNFAELTNGKVIVSAKDSLYQIDILRKEAFQIDTNLDGRSVTALLATEDESILVGTDDGDIYMVNPETGETRLRTTLSQHEPAAITALQNFKGELWAGSNVGLFQIDEKYQAVKRFSSEDSQLSHNHVTTFLEVDNLFFIGTYSGLDQVEDEQFVTLNYENSRVFDDVMSFEEVEQSGIWVGTFSGLYSLEETDEFHSRIEWPKSESRAIDERIMCLEAIGETLYIGTWSQGVKVLNTSTGAIDQNPFPLLRESSITKILKDSPDTVWIATFDDGVWRTSGSSVKRYDELEDEPVLSLHLTKNNTLFAIGEASIYRFDRTKDRFQKLAITFVEGLDGVTFFTLLSIDEATLLAGTKDHGLLKIRQVDKTLSYAASGFSLSDSTLQASIYAVLEDDNNGYWVSSSDGAYRLNEKGKVVERYAASGRISFNFGAYFKKKDGAIYFGGNKGYIKFRAQEAGLSLKAPRTVISEFRVSGDESLDFTVLRQINRLVFRARDKSLSFRINVLDYQNPFINKYQYKLENFDEDWINNGTNNKASYTNLPAGDYTFLAKGANAAGVWSENPVSLKVRILPPWWQTYWAFVFYSLCAVFLVWGVLKIHRTQILRREAERRADEMLALADLAQDELLESHEAQDELVLASHQHNLATIELIRDIVASDPRMSRTDEVSTQLHALTALERCYYFQDGKLLANLKDYVDIICDALLPRASVEPATITTINLCTAALIPAEIAAPTAIIFKELIENSLQHAFAAESHANYLQIKADIARHDTDSHLTLTLSVQDDGVGLPSGVAISTAGSAGFRVVNRLCETLGGKIVAQTGAGTNITATIPLPIGFH